MKTAPRKKRSAPSTLPDAESEFLTGLIELYVDDPAKAREAVGLLATPDFTIDGGGELLVAIGAALAVDTPTMADLTIEIARRFPEDVAEVVATLLRKTAGDVTNDLYRACSRAVERRAGEIAEAARRRRVAAAADHARDVADDPAADVAEMEQALALVAAAGVLQTIAKPEPLPTLTSCIEAWRIDEQAPTLETGFGPLDRLGGGGLPLGGLTVFAARPAAGKSALALQAVLGALSIDPALRAVWCLGEMSEQAIARRAISCWSGQQGRRPVSMTSAKARSRGAVETAGELAVAVADRLSIVKPPLTIDTIEHAVATTGAKLLVVDYVQLVELAGAQDRRGEVDGVVKRLRVITLRENLATILISNISKTVDGSTRIGAIGKESGELDFAADLFLLGVADDEEGENGNRAVRWRCAKNRHGRCDDMEAIFDGGLQVFTPAGAEEHEDFAGYGPRAAQGAR